MIQINSRHKFLDGFLGTKEEEDISFAMANKVNLWTTVTTCVCCVLEMVLYFVFNRMVNKSLFSLYTTPLPKRVKFYVKLHDI